MRKGVYRSRAMMPTRRLLRSGVEQREASLESRSSRSTWIPVRRDRAGRMGRIAIQRALPVYTVNKANTPEIYWFTVDAINRGAPTTLTYVPNATSQTYVMVNGHIVLSASVQPGTVTQAVTIRDVQRFKTFQKGTQLDGAKKYAAPGYSRDEYPYASTMDGGEDGYWAYVPATEQNIQGGTLGGFYAGNVPNGGQFRVALNPSV